MGKIIHAGTLDRGFLSFLKSSKSPGIAAGEEKPIIQLVKEVRTV